MSKEDMFSGRHPFKGGQNPPNTSSRRPPPPQGSGGNHSQIAEAAARVRSDSYVDTSVPGWAQARQDRMDLVKWAVEMNDSTLLADLKEQDLLGLEFSPHEGAGSWMRRINNSYTLEFRSETTDSNRGLTLWYCGEFSMHIAEPTISMLGHLLVLLGVAR